MPDNQKSIIVRLAIEKKLQVSLNKAVKRNHRQLDILRTVRKFLIIRLLWLEAF
jgi:hypothetical protein